MDLELGVFQPKSKLEYMYDFANTTYLTVEFLNFFEFELSSDHRFWLLGRNEAFEYTCVSEAKQESGAFYRLRGRETQTECLHGSGPKGRHKNCIYSIGNSDLRILS